MILRNRNEQGFALVYALVALLIVTIGGTALLFMVRKDRAGTTDYSSVRATAKAAEAALRACEGQFINHPDTALAILKAFAKNDNCKWICNSSVANAATEVWYELNNGTGAPRYNAKIVSFDSVTALLTIEGVGYGDYGAKKKSLALYKLDGIEIVTPAPAATTVPGGRYALFIAKDGESFNWPATITGNVYFGGNFIMQAATRTVTINGNLKTGSSTSSASPIQSKLVVNGNAYFQSAVAFQNASSSITGRVGFEKSVALSANVSIGGDSVFSNSASSGSYDIVMQSGKTLLHSGSFNSSNLTGGTLKSNGSTISKMAERVGICPGNETAISIDISKIPAASRVSYATVFGATYSELLASKMNTYYQNNPSKLWNGYLVIDAAGASPQWNANPGTFNYKVIWILNGSIYFNPIFNSASDNKTLYNSGTASSSIFYLSGGAQIAPCVWSGTLRGYFYVTGSGNELLKFYNFNQTLLGGINIKSTGSDPFEFTGPSTGTDIMKITYDESVIQGLVDVGLASWPGSCEVSSSGGGGGGSGAPALKLVDLKIRPRLLSMQL
jgi:Tfp pilus assembly protein PilX